MGIGEVLKTGASEGKEKHVPVIKVDGNKVIVKVGDEVEHPNTPEHHIAWVALYGVTKDKKLTINLGRAEFAPGFTSPKAMFKLENPENISKLYSVSYCNLHGVWEDSLDL